MLPHRLICLGTPHLVGPDGEPIRLRTRKHLALLVWLCREPSIAHRRDRLATLFWPRPAIEEARHSLVTAISMMRGKIGRDAFETTRETIRLLPGYIVTDLEALEREDPLETDDVPIAPFLEEFEIPRVPDFSLWVDAERNQTLPVLQRHLSHRIDRCRQTGDTRRMGEIAALLGYRDRK